MPLILEGIVTTRNSDGTPNVSPMGPIVDATMTQLTLRPYRSSRTYSNLKRYGVGVFHVCDDVELIARAAVGEWDLPPAVSKCPAIDGFVLDTTCRWYAFRVTALDDTEERTTIECRVEATERLRDFFGFNRAKHAVVEAAILATRVGILPPDEVRESFQRLAVIVQKTAGEQEERAFAFLERTVRLRLGLDEAGES